MNEWQPIETAPKDGTDILLRSNGGKIANGNYVPQIKYRNPGWIWPYLHCEPAYWAPLPPPPKDI